MVDEAVTAGRRMVEVVLYLNPGSASSAKARRNLDAVLAECDPATFRLIVRDVSQDLEQSEADHIVFAPTLIVRDSLSTRLLVGDLADRMTVSATLSLGGMERSG
jgi:hypothetical protein